jgi:hypothetical protein
MKTKIGAAIIAFGLALGFASNAGASVSPMLVPALLGPGDAVANGNVEDIGWRRGGGFRRGGWRGGGWRGGGWRRAHFAGPRFGGSRWGGPRWGGPRWGPRYAYAGGFGGPVCRVVWVNRYRPRFDIWERVPVRRCW